MRCNKKKKEKNFGKRPGERFTFRSAHKMAPSERREPELSRFTGDSLEGHPADGSSGVLSWPLLISVWKNPKVESLALVMNNEVFVFFPTAR